MKKLILQSFFIVSAIGIWAQAPDYFNYQAMLRNPNGAPMVNKNITLVVDIIRDQMDGPSIYLESHEVQTNELGMVSLKIGDPDPSNELQTLSVDDQELSISGGNMGIGTDSPEAMIHINNGDAYIDDSQHGLILTSPVGKHFRIEVRDDGTLFTEQVFL